MSCAESIEFHFLCYEVEAPHWQKLQKLFCSLLSLSLSSEPFSLSFNRRLSPKKPTQCHVSMLNCCSSSRRNPKNVVDWTLSLVLRLLTNFSFFFAWNIISHRHRTHFHNQMEWNRISLSLVGGNNVFLEKENPLGRRTRGEIEKEKRNFLCVVNV